MKVQFKSKGFITGVPFNKLPSTPGAINYNYGNDGSIIKPKQPYALTPKVPIKTKTQSAIDQIGKPA